MSNCTFQPRVDVGSTTMYEKLRAPYGISDLQRAEASEIIKEAEKDLDAYDTEICLLETKLAFLRSQRGRLIDHKFTLSSLLSQIHRLPNELLTRIFVFSCEENNLGSYYKQSGNAMSISAVCSRWRCLAVSCSKLWSRFAISLCTERSFQMESNRRLDALLDVYLQRSSQQLLSLTIDAKWWYDEDGDNVVKEHPLLSKLAGTSPRWQHAKLLIQKFSPDYYRSLEALDLSALETLVIDQRDDSSVELGLLSSAARLHTLSVEHCSPTDADASLLQHITTLEYTPHFDTFFETLDLCPNLRDLELMPYNFDSEDDNANYSHRTVSLTSLCVCFAESVEGQRGMLGIALDSLTAPSLSSLTLGQINMGSYSRPGCRPFRQIDAFIERSGCALTLLELSRVSISDKEVVALLKRLRSLVDLKVEDPDGHTKTYTLPITKALVESLHAHQKCSLQSSLQPLVPKLHSLTLTVRSGLFDHASFISTVQSRWIPDEVYAAKIGVSCLRSVELYSPSSPLDAESYSPLAHFEKSGMHIVVGK